MRSSSDFIGGIVVQLWTTIAIALASRPKGRRIRSRRLDLLVTTPAFSPFCGEFRGSFCGVRFIGSARSARAFGVFEMGLFMLPLQIGSRCSERALGAIEAWFLAATTAVSFSYAMREHLSLMPATSVPRLSARWRR